LEFWNLCRGKPSIWRLKADSLRHKLCWKSSDEKKLFTPSQNNVLIKRTASFTNWIHTSECLMIHVFRKRQNYLAVSWILREVFEWQRKSSQRSLGNCKKFSNSPTLDTGSLEMENTC
jgi:hypothetical protein